MNIYTRRGGEILPGFLRLGRSVGEAPAFAGPGFTRVAPGAMFRTGKGGDWFRRV